MTLKVYDVLGREVVTLVNEVKQPGRYEVTFDASGLASGVYFYRLFAVPTGAHSGPPSVLMQQRKMAVLR
ncbi:MAG: hypothetical protein KatS3mg109_1731 [Pirellulaceae bacterium]|nr:MAG: hypothetical protein KatS3mg109_1731 [Pirellulaceae bacterium]